MKQTRENRSILKPTIKQCSVIRPSCPSTFSPEGGTLFCTDIGTSALGSLFGDEQYALAGSEEMEEVLLQKIHSEEFSSRGVEQNQEGFARIILGAVPQEHTNSSNANREKLHKKLAWVEQKASKRHWEKRLDETDPTNKIPNPKEALNNPEDFGFAQHSSTTENAKASTKSRKKAASRLNSPTALLFKRVLRVVFRRAGGRKKRTEARNIPGEGNLSDEALVISKDESCSNKEESCPTKEENCSVEVGHAITTKDSATTNNVENEEEDTEQLLNMDAHKYALEAKHLLDKAADFIRVDPHEVENLILKAHSYAKEAQKVLLTSCSIEQAADARSTTETTDNHLKLITRDPLLLTPQSSGNVGSEIAARIEREDRIRRLRSISLFTGEGLTWEALTGQFVCGSDSSENTRLVASETIQILDAIADEVGLDPVRIDEREKASLLTTGLPTGSKYNLRPADWSSFFRSSKTTDSMFSSFPSVRASQDTSKRLALQNATTSSEIKDEAPEPNEASIEERPAAIPKSLPQPPIKKSYDSKPMLKEKEGTSTPGFFYFLPKKSVPTRLVGKDVDNANPPLLASVTSSTSSSTMSCISSFISNGYHSAASGTSLTGVVTANSSPSICENSIVSVGSYRSENSTESAASVACSGLLWGNRMCAAIELDL